MLAGNTNDKTPLADFLQKIEAQHGKAGRIWIMNRGIPTGEVLEKSATIPMPDVHLPTTDQPTVILRLDTHPETDVPLLLERLKLGLPAPPCSASWIAQFLGSK